MLTRRTQKKIKRHIFAAVVGLIFFLSVTAIVYASLPPKWAQDPQVGFLLPLAIGGTIAAVVHYLLYMESRKLPLFK